MSARAPRTRSHLPPLGRRRGARAGGWAPRQTCPPATASFVCAPPRPSKIGRGEVHYIQSLCGAQLGRERRAAASRLQSTLSCALWVCGARFLVREVRVRNDCDSRRVHTAMPMGNGLGVAALARPRRCVPSPRRRWPGCVGGARTEDTTCCCTRIPYDVRYFAAVHRMVSFF